MNTIMQSRQHKYTLPSPLGEGMGMRLWLLLAAFVIGLSFTATAQDSRNRVTSTIIADGLAQLPAQNLETLEQVMSEIAGTGAEGLQMLTDMLYPSDQGKNAPFQYAIDGLTNYVSQQGREAQADVVRKGLEAAIAKCTDEGNKAFLTDQLAKLNPGKQVVQRAAEDLKVVAPASRLLAEFRDKVAAMPTGKQASFLLKTLKNPDRQLRTTALDLADELSLQDFDALVVKAYPKLKADAQTDVLRWLGNTHNQKQADLVVAAIASPDKQLSDAAVEAAGRIGGEKALAALVKALKAPHAAQASAAIAAFNGDIKAGILSALQSEGTAVSKEVVELAGVRRIREAYQPLTQLIGKDGVHFAAVKSLAQIVTPETFGDLLQRFQPYPENYYGLLAQRGQAEDIQQLVAAAKEGSYKAEAGAALLKVESSDAVQPLLALAQADAGVRDAFLGRVLTLTKKANWASLTKYQLYRQALEMKPSAEVADKLIAALGTLNNEPALNLAATYMDVKDNDLAAAHAVADLIGKNEPLQRGEHVRAMLLKAQQVFKSHTENADAGYAVDQVNTILPKVVDDPNAATAKLTVLSEEEQKAGFELLFDGTSLDKWKGNKTVYMPIDGAIYVSAQYGSEGNLYTTRKYSDFVFRFEFCFVRPGVNNGVGIRTSEGVDAAFEGMEIQILDHDDPIYKGLQPYQQHGSVYGVIVPEHVNFGPLGTWNTEEIRAEGDHITVTVNGRVILDGNIRDACQGHHVSPEAGKPNPYTVDHRDHPGLFNKDGLISFCGHGEGLKLRNIRVLDLTQAKSAKKGKARK